MTAIESITMGKSSFATTPDPPPDWLVLAGPSDRKVLVEVPSGHVITVAAGSADRLDPPDQPSGNLPALINV